MSLKKGVGGVECFVLKKKFQNLFDFSEFCCMFVKDLWFTPRLKKSIVL